jgi:hypothetical protein
MSGAALSAIVGARHVLTDGAAQPPYLSEWRERYAGRASVVVAPGSTEEVAAILALANAHALPIVPQGETPASLAARRRCAARSCCASPASGRCAPSTPWATP